MLIYGVSGIFANKKTIKQFLQPMIEQVGVVGGGGGECAGRMCCFSDVSFSVATVFLCWFYSIHRCLFLGADLYLFCYILCVFHQNVKQCFGHKIFVMYN